MMNSPVPTGRSARHWIFLWAGFRLTRDATGLEAASGSLFCHARGYKSTETVLGRVYALLKRKALGNASGGIAEGWVTSGGQLPNGSGFGQPDGPMQMHLLQSNK